MEIVLETGGVLATVMFIIFLMMISFGAGFSVGYNSGYNEIKLKEYKNIISKERELKQNKTLFMQNDINGEISIEPYEHKIFIPLNFHVEYSLSLLESYDVISNRNRKTSFITNTSKLFTYSTLKNGYEVMLLLKVSKDENNPSANTYFVLDLRSLCLKYGSEHTIKKIKTFDLETNFQTGEYDSEFQEIDNEVIEECLKNAQEEMLKCNLIQKKGKIR